jgi:hypothetical protein
MIVGEVMVNLDTNNLTTKRIAIARHAKALADELEQIDIDSMVKVDELL